MEQLLQDMDLLKWKQDLEFVLQYKMSEQDEYEIKHIKKYIYYKNT